MSQPLWTSQSGECRSNSLLSTIVESNQQTRNGVQELFSSGVMDTTIWTGLVSLCITYQAVLFG